VEGAASDQGAVVIDRDAELLDRFVEQHALLAEKDATLNKRFDQGLDRGNVGGDGRANGETHAQ
jgi:hypothetical protein